MTNAPETIEGQLEELKNQYKHACNLISELTELGKNQRQMIERRDQMINELRETITATEQKLTAAECKACRCDAANCC